MIQDKFLHSKTKYKFTHPGGRGSGRKSWVLRMNKLKENAFMKTSVTKIIRFETGHQLTDSYAKACQTAHGHSYKAEVTFEGTVDSKTGMIIDFKKIKEILEPVIEKYDHQFFTFKTFGENPTAENMAMDIFNMVRSKSRLIKRVKLWETATCYCEVGY